MKMYDNLKFEKNKIIIYKMDYYSLIKLCQKYDIDYRNHYGKSKSYIKLKRKVQQYENNKNKKNLQNIL